MTELLASVNAPSPLLVLVVALGGAPASLLLGWKRPRVAAWAAVTSALLAMFAVILAWRSGGGAVTVPWAPTWGLRLRLTYDGVSAVYGLLATGIGTVVLVYSAAYMPRHLHHHHRAQDAATAFYALMLLFMGAMVGLVMADDLILLFLFWDMTAVVSYFLIGFDRDEPASRPAALMALLVTGGSAVLMLGGIVALWMANGTTSIAELIADAPRGAGYSVAIALIAVAALAKSAQVPLHFWLPRAMVAPTPVSSYLHSAAMVAAGVFLLARILPLVHRAEWVPEGLVAIGVASIASGGLFALSRDDLKRILAYSTIGQYGYVVTMLGIGGKYGAIGAALYVMAHGMAKCALFLTAGAVSEATGRRALSELGGLARAMPMLAMASGIAAATIAALPLTIGFFKDELFFATMRERGTPFAAIAVLSAALTFAYMGRFWGKIFLGESDAETEPIPSAMSGAVAALAAICLVSGLWIGSVNGLANAGGSATLRESEGVSLAYHIDARAENVMALAAYALGLGILATSPLWNAIARGANAIGERLGPERIYRQTLLAGNALSDRLHAYEIHDLRGRVAWVLLPVGVLVLLGVLFTSNEGAFLVGPLAGSDWIFVLLLAVTCGAAITTSQMRSHLAAAVLLSVVGYVLAAIYAFLGAPDVALVAVLMETMVSLLLIGFLAAMRDRPRVEGFETGRLESHRWRDRVLGAAAALASFVVIWGVLSKPAALQTVASEQIALTPAAHAKDVVTAILADFRGLDTMGEITVIGITLVGLLTLLQHPLSRRTRE